MKYISTRGASPALSFSDAVATGLAPDKGLYLPEKLPDIRPHLAQWQQLDYAGLCEAFLGLFATDVPAQALSPMVKDAYSRYTHTEVAPLVPLSDSLSVLELFHGPTLAFKDFALQLLGNLYEAQIARTGKPINILGATSGDTGSAAIHGLLGKAGVRLFILYPEGRISPLQERQMTTTGASNVFPIAIDGTFDDAQRIVKALFADLEFKSSRHLSAINSINLARILAQCVYYVWAWLQLPEAKRNELEFVVPTGNFGNVLAGWMTQQMGLPVESFRVAVNQNDILHRYFTTGAYQVGTVTPSHAPSMDIQVASNFERFLYYRFEGDTAKVAQVMQTLQSQGAYRFEGPLPAGIKASRTSDKEILENIQRIHRDYGYIADPHTACGFNFPQDGLNRVVLATASPAKFPDVIEQAIAQRPIDPVLEALKQRPIIKTVLPATEAAIREQILQHGGVH
jgi:threonine synthase